jgi:hypothetical protein
MTRFIAHFDSARDYTLQFTVTHSHTSVYSQFFTAVAWYRLTTADIPLSLGSRTVSVPHLPASNSCSSQGLNPSGSLTATANLSCL